MLQVLGDQMNQVGTFQRLSHLISNNPKPPISRLFMERVYLSKG